MNAKKTKSIVKIKPKPPFRPAFQVAAQREKSVIHIINGLEDKPPSPALFLVEMGESRTPPETILEFVQGRTPQGLPFTITV